MELAKLLEAKKTELEQLKQSLSALQTDLKTVKGEYPPRWNGNAKELSKFITDLREWVKNPKLKRAREIIDLLKENANDKRSLKGLGDDYLVGVLPSLEDIAQFLPSIENEALGASASAKILDSLQGEDDLDIIIRDAKKYWLRFSSFEGRKTENQFLETIRLELVASLARTADFSVEAVQKAENVLKKAASAIDLLKGSGIQTETYMRTYTDVKSVDTIWDKAERIRKLLSGISIASAEDEDIGEPFAHMVDIIKRRNECISCESLTQIHDCLETIDTEMRGWKDEVRKEFNAQYQRTKALLEFAKVDSNVDGLLDDFTKKLEEFSDLGTIYSSYRLMMETKNEATKSLEREFSEMERNVIENLDNADALALSMGDDFWAAIRSLRQKGLIKVVLRRGA
jgi:hypothetical protein